MKPRPIATETSPLPDRIRIWGESTEAAEKHIKLGQTLQGQGVKALQELQAGGDIESIAKATAVIEKGIKIERDGRSWLMELHELKPAAKRRSSNV